MLCGKRLAIHRDRHQGLTLARHGPGRGKAGRPAIDRAAHDLGRPALHACSVEQLAQANAAPQRIPDEVAADLVADAGDGHVFLVERHGDELVVGQLERVVDHPIDP